ncbi:MAG: cytochrome d ubiquinol oxidase subunit II [Gammaproteobacteria bacterium]|nr:cytochrome d ubiquinol oxidase subunit II [Gammaproteobacteria bacterium]
MNTLALIWLGLIAFTVMMYVILDGFTLGIALLFPWIKGSEERDIMISSVLPVWDGNETWLVFAAAALYAGFPEAFGALMTALYLPLMVLIVGLLLRGVSFEFIHKATKTSAHIWEKCFCIGSCMAVFAQGIFVSQFIQGFSRDPQSGEIVAGFIGNPLHIFCIIALLVGYSLLGSARLIKKTEGSLQEKLFTISNRLQWMLLSALILIGLFSPPTSSNAHKIWFVLPHSPFMVFFILTVTLLMVFHAIGIKRRKEQVPFPALAGIFVITYLGFGLNTLPYIVPYQLTFMDAKVDDHALLIMLYGASVLLPLLLAYTFYAYHVFRGKINASKKVSY